MRQFLKLLGRTRIGHLTPQPQRLRDCPRRPATLLYQREAAVQGEKSPAHNPDSGDVFASTSLALRHVTPCACAVHSISSPAHTADRLPPHTSHLHAATATPLTPPPSTLAVCGPTALLSHQNSLQDALPPTPTSPQTSPPPPAQTSLSPLLVSSCSPHLLFTFSLLPVYLFPPQQKIWDAPGNLTNLRFLHLYGNELSGAIPGAVGPPHSSARAVPVA